MKGACPKGDGCALNSGARHCFHCRRNWPRDETWDLPFDQRPIRERSGRPRMKGASCCLWHLLTRPRGWAGHVTWCQCGTLLVLRDGAWTRD